MCECSVIVLYRRNEELQSPAAYSATGNVVMLLKISIGKCCL